MNKVLAEKIKTARGEMTAEAFAIKMGVSYSTVRNWEAGRNEPSASRLSKIAAVTGRSIDWFFEGAA